MGKRGWAVTRADRTRNKQKARIALVVLGMHRSGTSALSRVLDRAGAELPVHLMHPQTDNPTGFWESQPLTELSDEILATHGLNWDSVGRIPLAWFDGDEARGLATRYAELFASEFPGEGPFLLKDPRLCRLLPLLPDALGQLGVEPRYLVSLRHPLEVAQSLQTRNGLDLERGLALWLEHYLLAEKYTRSSKRLLIGYPRVLSDWRGVVDKIARQLKVPLNYQDGRITAELDATITTALHHQRADLGADDRLPPAVVQAWVALQALEAERDGKSARHMLDRLLSRVEAAEGLFATLADKEARRAREAVGERDRLRQQHETLAAANRDLRAELEAARATCQQVREASEDQLGQAVQARDEATGEARVLSEQLHEARSRLDQFQEHKQALERRLDDARHALRQAEDRQGEWQQQLADMREQITAREARLDQLRREHDQQGGDVRRLEEQLEQALSRATRLEQARDELQSRLASLMRTAASDQSSLQALTVSLRDKLSQEKNRVKALERASKKLQSRLEAEAKSHAGKRAGLQAQKQSIDASLKQEKQRNSALEKTLREVRKKLGAEADKAATDRSRLKTRLETLASQGKQKQREIDALKRSLSTETKDRYALEQQLAAEQARFTARIESLEAALADSRAYTTALESELQSSQAQTAREAQLNRQLETQLAAASQHTQQLRQDYDASRVQYGALQAQIERLEAALEQNSALSEDQRSELRALLDSAGERDALQLARLESQEGMLEQLVHATGVHEQRLEARIQSLRDALSEEQARHESVIASQQLDLARLHIQNTRLTRELRRVYASRSWRLGAPLRMGAGWLRAVRHHAAALVSGRRRPGVTGPLAGLAPARYLGRRDARQRMCAEVAQELDAFLAGPGRMQLPSPGSRPLVSVLVVLHEQVALTLACVRSLLESRQRDFELILVDNDSRDRTGELLERIDNALIIRNRENLHFLRAVNQAAQRARGDYLLLLNNDTRLHPGALGAALAVFEQEPDVGAVGGRIVLPDGSLQEAGGVIRSDGSCTGHGRGEPPDATEFDVRRDVAYCSGAFLLTPKAQFEQLGGLDERYAPAYYEDADYCLRLHEQGLRVIYEPGAWVLHLEFGSADEAAAAALSARNQAVFVARHYTWLQRQGEAPPEALGNGQGQAHD